MPKRLSDWSSPSKTARPFQRTTYTARISHPVIAGDTLNPTKNTVSQGGNELLLVR